MTKGTFAANTFASDTFASGVFEGGGRTAPPAAPAIWIRGGSRRTSIVRPLELNPDSPFARGLVGCWLMGNRACWKSGKLLDLSPYGNHGTLTNMDPQTDWVHDGTRAGLDFDGVNDWVALSSAERVSLQEFSVVAWVSTRITSTSQRITSFSNSGNTAGTTLQFHKTTGRFALWTNNGSWVEVGRDVGPIVATNEWYFVCATRTGNVMAMYVDGVLAEEVVTSGTINYSGITAELGRRQNGSEWLSGTVNCVLLFNRALTASEVAQLYHETRDGSYGSLVKSPRTQVFMPATVASGVDMPYVVTARKTDSVVERLELNPDSPFAKGLVGCWLMGAAQHWGSAKLLDLSPYENHMDIIGNPLWLADDERAHVWFDTTDDYAKSTYNGLGGAGQSFSVGIWYRNGPPAGSGNRFIVSNYVDGSHAGFFAIGTRYETGMFAWLRDTTATTVAQTAEYTPAWDNQWHHYLFARDIDNSEVRFYIDGVLRETIVTSNANAVRDGNSFIGLIRHYGTTAQTATGRVGLVSAWLQALPDSFVRQFYHETKDGSYGSLVKPAKRRMFGFISSTPAMEMPYVVTPRKSGRVVERLELNHDSPFARGLVGCWLMGNRTCWKSGKLLDLSPYGNHGTLTNMDPQTDWVHDGTRAGLDFDGSNDYITTSLTDDKKPSGAMTLTAWVRGRSSSSNSCGMGTMGFDGSRGFALAFDSGTTAHFWIPSSASSFVSVSLSGHNSARHTMYSGVFEPSTSLSLYRDGQLGATNTASVPAAQYTSNGIPFRIGVRGDTLAFFVGTIGLVTLHNRALTADEITQLYEETRDGSHGSLVQSRRRIIHLPETTPPPPLAKTRRRLQYPPRRLTWL